MAGPVKRKGRKPPPLGAEDAPDGEGARARAQSGSRGTHWALQLLPVLVFFGFAAVVLGCIYWKFGWKIFMSPDSKRLRLGVAEWQEQILPLKTIVMIGGPHRGGTTVLWECLRQHEDVGDFGTTFQSGSDFSEGIFLQDVYPQFGVGGEIQSMMPGGQAGKGGMGKYLFAEEELVHWTEEHPLVSEESQARLLNSFGYHWNLSKRVLLEKSPPNMHLGRFLQAVLNQGAPQPRSVARFVFISRHPIANALAHRSLRECRDLSITDLVHHWVIAHEYLAEDFRRLDFARNLTLEAFAQDPAKHVAELWEFMGIGAGGAWDPASSQVQAAVQRVRRDPNAKYRGAYCRTVTSSEEDAKGHQRLVRKFNSRVQDVGLGYDLNEWHCLASIV